MDLNKINECDSPLVGRKTYTFKASYTGQKTPSESEVSKAVASNLKIDDKLVEVGSIMQDYGSASATVEVYVYKDIGSRKRFGSMPKEEAPAEKKE